MENPKLQAGEYSFYHNFPTFWLNNHVFSMVGIQLQGAVIGAKCSISWKLNTRHWYWSQKKTTITSYQWLKSQRIRFHALRLLEHQWLG